MNALEEYCRLNNISTANDSIDSSGPMSSNLGLSKLNNIRTLVIKQSFQPIEFFTGFQQENSYSVFGIDENGIESEDQIFECNEQSNIILRLLMSPESRPFKAMILNYPSKTSFIQLQRKFKCTFFCYNRPRLDVILTEGSEKQYLGSIIVPFKFSFDNRMEIYGYNRKLKYIIIGSCCQMGLIAKSLPFEKCQKAEFCIFDGLTNKKITKIKKFSAGFWKSTLSNADNFSIDFPRNTKVEDKALLMAATFFLDFNSFENKYKK